MAEQITRREALTKIVKGAGPAAAAVCMVGGMSGTAHASETRMPSQAVGMLYDATKCIGCKACVTACVENNGLPADTRLTGLHLAPTDLNDLTRNIIKLYQPENPKQETSYVKYQCMHCADPSCVLGCPFEALYKDKRTGAVQWDGAKCIGCRYCTVTCPFNVPKFQWLGFNPRITKCEFCSHRLAQGLEPACTSVCPTDAVIFGRREALLLQAKERIKANPKKYYEERVYGEHDNGGLQVLYLSRADVKFEDIGLPKLGNTPVTDRLKWQKRVYSYMLFPAVLYAGMVTMIKKRLKPHEEEMHESEKKTGLRGQR